MPRYIDADKFIKEQCNSCDGYCEDIRCDCLNCDSDCRCDMIQDLQSAPTISPDEARGVVHCRECSHAERRMPIGIKTEIFCKLLTVGVCEDGFCSFGKRGAKMEVTSDA